MFIRKRWFYFEPQDIWIGADCDAPIFYTPGYSDRPKKICLACALGQKAISE